MSPRYTSMPPREQRTPFGTATIQSYWKRDRYYLRVSGPLAALRWLFPTEEPTFERIGLHFRHAFNPSPTDHPVTVERELRRICGLWQSRWDERLQDHEPGHPPAADGTAAASVEPVIATIGDLFDRCFEHRTAEIAKTTQERDRYYLKLWRPILGEGTPLSWLRQQQLIDARARIAKETSVANANCATALLKTYLRWAYHKNLMTDVCLRGLKRLKEGAARTTRAWWGVDEVRLALRCAQEDEHPRNAVLLVGVGCLAGLRLEEIIMLRWEDLELDRKHPVTGKPEPLLYVRARPGWQPKTGEERSVSVHDDLHALLLKYRQPAGYVLMPLRSSDRPRKESAAWSYRFDPRRTWERLSERIRAAGGKPITMAGMRHTFASNNLSAGLNEWAISKSLGHKDLRMVARHYGFMRGCHDAINTIRYLSHEKLEAAQ